MIKEIWKPIKGFENQYEISNIGRVKSLKRLVKHGKGKRPLPEKILKPSKLQRTKKYTQLQIHLYKDSKGYSFYISRLVALHFVDNKHNKPFINHIDNNPENNIYTNLEWCTQKENIQHAVRQGRMPHNQFKKEVAQYDMNGNLIKIFESTMEVQRQLGIRNTKVSRVCLGERKSTGGFIFKYTKEKG